METKIALFKGKKVRKTIHNNEWWFSVIDVVEILTGSVNPRRYWSDLKRKLLDEEGYYELYDNIVQLKMLAHDDKMRETDIANTETMFRIVQSIPSPKAEPFKRWLAQVGYERIKEIEDPELATKRTRTLYKAKGYSDNWIEKRMRGIAIREELTDEWQQRGAKEERDYSILTAEISKATFGMTPSEYQEFKGLDRQNLRDHMNDLELILSMLGERATTEITRTEDSRGMPKLKSDAHEGGEIAGDAKKKLEKRLRRPVVSNDNYLYVPEDKRLLEKKD